MQDLMKKINEQLAIFNADATAFNEKGNKAAGTRARKATLELTKLFKEYRSASIEESKK